MPGASLPPGMEQYYMQYARRQQQHQQQGAPQGRGSGRPAPGPREAALRKFSSEMLGGGDPAISGHRGAHGNSGVEHLPLDLLGIPDEETPKVEHPRLRRGFSALSISTLVLGVLVAGAGAGPAGLALIALGAGGVAAPRAKRIAGFLFKMSLPGMVINHYRRRARDAILAEREQQRLAEQQQAEQRLEPLPLGPDGRPNYAAQRSAPAPAAPRAPAVYPVPAPLPPQFDVPEPAADAADTEVMDSAALRRPAAAAPRRAAAAPPRRSGEVPAATRDAVAGLREGITGTAPARRRPQRGGLAD